MQSRYKKYIKGLSIVGLFWISLLVYLEIKGGVPQAISNGVIIIIVFIVGMIFSALLFDWARQYKRYLSPSKKIVYRKDIEIIFTYAESSDKLFSYFCRIIWVCKIPLEDCINLDREYINFDHNIIDNPNSDFIINFTEELHKILNDLFFDYKSNTPFKSYDEELINRKWHDITRHTSLLYSFSILYNGIIKED